MYTITSSSGSYTISNTGIAALTVLIIWELFWKGLALWKAGRHDQKAWFILILILNTAGILEIFYLLFFQAKKKTKKEE